jgi:membrane associated rhomboid family serine protease
MDSETEPAAPLVDVGRYGKLSHARERGLVVSAMELPHWIVREGEAFILRVEAPASDRVQRELSRYEAERIEVAEEKAAAPAEKLETLSLYVVAWLMGTCWLLQNLASPSALESGKAASAAIASGEWWRTFTALTLHGDFGHLAANMATGLLFGAFALLRFGTGVAWLLVVLSGALGNLLNALFYRSQPHISIGASTAVFGALGLIVAAEFVARFSQQHTRSRWQLIVPIGAGLGLLAFLGVGEEHRQIDYMAHFWGFIAGLAIGACAAALRVKERATVLTQRVAAISAPALLLLAWWLALR